MDTLTLSSLVTLYKSEFAEVHYDPDMACLCFTWIKFSPSKIFREIFEASSERALRNKPQRILLDQRQVKIIAPADQAWLIEEWFKKTMQLNQQPCKLAFVDTEDVFGKLSIKNVISKINGLSKNSIAMAFARPEDARAWLTQ